jgi:hypothetical protein
MPDIRPDYGYCRETQQVVGADSSTYKVTTAMGYDSFGNLCSANHLMRSKFGSAATQAGDVYIVGGAIASVAGAREVAVPVMAAGGVAAGTGGLFTYAGIGLQLAGGLILNYYGNPQPLRSAGFQAAAEVTKAGVNSVFDHMMDLPLPDPFDPLVERAAGESRCP